MKTPRLLVVITLIMLLGRGVYAAKDSCFECHGPVEGMSLVYTNDLHYTNAISCAHCHGGDPSESNQNISMNASRGFKVRPTRQTIPAFCGSCHGDTNAMSKYSQEPRLQVLALYKTGVHGKLLASGRKGAAECVDCHSVHNIRPPSDPQSKASPQKISATCGKCHGSTLEAYANTRHGQMFNNQRRPGCTVCHASHDTQPATTAMLTGATSVCVRCHRSGTPPLQLAADMAKVLTDLETAGPGSKEALDRARVAVHTMNLAAVKKAAEPVPQKTDGN